MCKGTRITLDLALEKFTERQNNFNKIVRDIKYDTISLLSGIEINLEETDDLIRFLNYLKEVVGNVNEKEIDNIDSVIQSLNSYKDDLTDSQIYLLKDNNQNFLDQVKLIEIYSEHLTEKLKENI